MCDDGVRLAPARLGGAPAAGPPNAPPWRLEPRRQWVFFGGYPGMAHGDETGAGGGCGGRALAGYSVSLPDGFQMDRMTMARCVRSAECNAGGVLVTTTRCVCASVRADTEAGDRRHVMPSDGTRWAVDLTRSYMRWCGVGCPDLCIAPIRTGTGNDTVCSVYQ